MRDGLAHEEGYAPWGAVPRMLWGETDVGALVDAPAEAAAGSRWRYLSATTNLLSRAVAGPVRGRSAATGSIRARRCWIGSALIR